MASLTRRELVRRSARVAAAAALASQAEWLAACGGEGGPSDADWDMLARRLRGALVRPGQAGYAALHRPSNLRYDDVRPEGIAVVEGTEDVRQAILWARDHGVALVPKAGGHSYSGYSTTPGLLVDLTRMRHVAVDRRTGVASVEAGAQNTDIYNGLQPYGVAFSAGRCPTVGVSGLTLGGGFGFSSRRIGLSADALLETEIVTAAGEVLRCSERENPDLFWACRGGGGGNFGVNTLFTFRSWPVEYVTLYDLTWEWKHAREVLAALQEVAREAPDEWSLRIGLGSVGRPGGIRHVIEAEGQFFGPKAELLSILDPVLTVARPTKRVIARRTFWQAKTYLYDTTPAGFYAVKSNFVTSPFGHTAIDVLADAIERWPGSSNPGGGGYTLFAWGGAIGKVRPEATAFTHRDARFLAGYGTSWGARDPQRLVSANLDWLDRLAADMRPYVSSQAYQNFVDRTLDGWERAYYGSNFDKLVEVKRNVDPENFFKFRQSIPTRV